MARYYRWASRRLFTGQYLLVWPRSGDVFSFLDSETSGNFYKSSWGVLERSRGFLAFVLSGRKIIAWPI